MTAIGNMASISKVFGTEDKFNTILIVEGPDDVLRQLLEEANNTLSIWGEGEDFISSGKRLFILENFYNPKGVALEAFGDEVIDQSFETVLIRGLSESFQSLAFIISSKVSAKFPALKFTMRYIDRIARQKYMWVSQCGTLFQNIGSITVPVEEDIEAWLEP